MKKENDKLSAEHSPGMLQKPGVKRVNNLPLLIAVGVLTLFVALIAYVAAKRAHQDEQVLPPVKMRGMQKSTKSLADEVVRNRLPRMASVAPKTETEESAVLPLNLTADPASPEESSLPLPPRDARVDTDVPDAELERIRQEKTQAFEEAVNAKTSISFESSKNHPGKDERGGMDSRFNQVLSGDVNQQFKEQMALLQGMQGKPKESPLTLGGSENEMRWQLNSTLRNPSSRFELRAGGVIPGVMVSGISSELPGQIIGQVSQNIYDTATGRYLLIPQGTKLIGIYSSEVAYGQNSVLVAWQRLVFPDGKALDIGSMPGADSAGYSGFRDKVNHHYVRIFGSAFLMSAIVAGITYSQNLNQQNPTGYAQPTAGSVLSQALGQQLGEVSMELVKKNLNVAPTVNIRPGYRFNVTVMKDLVFKTPYRQFSYS